MTDYTIGSATGAKVTLVVQGTTDKYTIYLKPASYSLNIQFKPTTSTELYEDGGICMSSMYGKYVWTLPLMDCYVSTVLNAGISDWTQLKMALTVASKENVLLTVTALDENNADMIQVIDFTTLALATFTGRVLNLAASPVVGGMKCSLTLNYFNI